ncbi:MFS transporter [Rhodococcus jostii]|uniref:Predicted arabinose efflux permease, MFS family n=1 Tax=Rhodococcus jostii TaxID=132919 RepID=A0A1H4IWB8_RHOJO|nr:MFS transporter [Rhodococcus jostii]SEB38421.1 Predicted arabinose efflux permease, MFS family [Rhodococcus jostii]
MKSTSQGDKSQLYQGRKVVAATLLGNTIEYYEFFIYGLSASLVFNQLFFPTFDPLVGTLLSLSTFAIAFVARPVGGWILGHFGDRLGRRPILMITLSGMGVATFAIGLLPTYDKIGIAAPICLVLLRLLQGLSLGGEASGGFIMTLEHAPRSHRTLFAGIVGSGNIWGLILGNGVFLAISQLPEDQLLSWGWRVPFLLSLALLIIAFYIRFKLEESPVFTAAKTAEETTSRPSAELIRRHARTLILTALSTLPVGITFYVVTTFSAAYGKTIAVSFTKVFTTTMIVAALLTVVIPFFGWLGDRIDRKLIFCAGIAVMIVSPFIWFPLFNTGNLGLMVLGFLVPLVGFSATYGVQGAFYPLLYPTAVRYSGLAISTNVGAVIGASIAPMIATYLLGSFQSWTAIACYMAAAGIVALLATLLLQESAIDDHFVEQSARDDSGSSADTHSGARALSMDRPQSL